MSLWTRDWKGHFGDESFQTVDYTGTDNQFLQGNKTPHSR